MNKINENESKIKEILISLGIKPEDIEFGVTWGTNPYQYLRVGYWESLSNNILIALGDLIASEESDYDEDCGYIYMYKIAEKK